MYDHTLDFHGNQITARSTGSLWWGTQKLLCVSDMHLGKSDSLAKQKTGLLPPFETQDTLVRLGDEIQTLNPKTVICLGDSFDDLKALDSLNTSDHKRLNALIAGREWIWIEGNHDAGPVELGGTHMKEYTSGSITFRHIARKDSTAEISGYYQPKARMMSLARGMVRKCFLSDSNKIILPAFGNHTGEISVNPAIPNDILDAKNTEIFMGQKKNSICYE